MFVCWMLLRMSRSALFVSPRLLASASRRLAVSACPLISSLCSALRDRDAFSFVAPSRLALSTDTSDRLLEFLTPPPVLTCARQPASSARDASSNRLVDAANPVDSRCKYLVVLFRSKENTGMVVVFWG